VNEGTAKGRGGGLRVKTINKNSPIQTFYKINHEKVGKRGYLYLFIYLYLSYLFIYLVEFSKQPTE